MRLNKTILFFAGSLLLAVSGCVTSDDTQSVEITSNDIKPSGNDIIQEEAIANAGNQNSRINVLQGAPDDTYIFGGTLNSKPAIAKTDKQGNIIWSVETSFQCNALKLVPDDTEKVIGLGAIDSDEDGSFDQGGFIIIDGDGNVIQDKNVSLEEDQLWFNGIDAYIKDEKLNILISGAINRSDNFFPYINRIVLDNAEDEATDEDFENFTILENNTGAIMLNAKRFVEGNTEKFYYTTNFFTSDGFPFKMTVGKLSGTFDNEDWTSDLTSADGTKLFGEPGENIRINGGNVYVIASQEDTPTGVGIDFLAGVIVSMDKNDGTVLWGQKHDFSEYTDQIKAFTIIDDDIYMSGIAASFNTNARAFSYGFLAKASLSDGNIIRIRTFGSDELSSRFNALRMENEQIIGLGSTNFSDGTSFDYWMVRVDLDDL